MRISQLSSLLLDDLVRKLKRRLILGAVILFCVIGAMIEGVSAGRRALENWLGDVNAHLTMMGILLVVGAGALGALLIVERRHSSAKAAREKAQQDPRAAILAEAVAVGYSLGRDFLNANAAEREAAEPAAADDSIPR